MKTIYKGHLPGRLGILTVGLSKAEEIVVRYASPGAAAPEQVESLQVAIDEDLADDDLISRLNYCSFLNGVIAERVKRAQREARAEEKRKEARSLGTPAPPPVPTIPITAENVDDLPESLSPETRRKIFERLGIEDQNEATE